MPEQFKFTKEEDQRVNLLLEKREELLNRISELEVELAQIYTDKSDSELKEEQQYVSAIIQHPIDNQIEALIIKEKEELAKVEEELSK